jgi:uncharacterized protein (TIGR03663 family)
MNAETTTLKPMEPMTPPTPPLPPSPTASAAAGGTEWIPRWGPLQWTLFGLLAAVCVFSRLYELGFKALMHDESLFVYYTQYQLYRGWTYNYMPILHGPLMLQIQAVIFHVFGNSDFTMRLGCALLGIAGFFVIWGLRPWFGEGGMWVALVFYTLSTGVTFYQRFFRNDALFMFLSLGIIYCACRWYRTGSRRWLVALVTAITLMFCNKENCVIFYFSGLTFFLFWVVQDTVQRFLQPRSSASAAAAPVACKTPVPNVFWLNVALWIFIVLCITRIFEGIRFDADVVRAVNHDWALKDVRSLKLVLGLMPEAAAGADAAVRPLVERPNFWRAFYFGGFVVTLVLLFVVKIFAEEGYGHKQALTRFWNGIGPHKWWLLAGLALCLFLYMGIFTTWYTHPRGPFKIYKDTFGYWAGQHAWHRIRGAFHYYWIMLLIYELPAVLLVVGGWFYAMKREHLGRTLGLPLLAVATLAALVYFNSPGWEKWMTSPVVNEAGKQLYPSGKALLDKTLKLDSGFHLYMIFVLSFFCVTLTWKALRRGEIFHAWLIWWAVTSIGGYSYAGEKVPWVGTHMFLPFILLAASYTGKFWKQAFVRRHAVLFGVLFGIFALWNGKAMVNACFRHSDDVRERIVYGHTSQDIRNHAIAIVNYWKRASIRLDWQRNHNDMQKLKDIRVLVKATDAAIWPMRWYLRDIEWTEYDDPAKANDKYAFVFLDANDLDKYPNIKEGYTIYRGRGRCFWQPRLPHWQRIIDIWLNLIPRQYLDGQNPQATRAKDAVSEWKKFKDYLLLRKTYEYPNAPFPSVSSVDYFFCVRKDIDL